MLGLIFKAYKMYEYRRDFMVLRFRFPVVFLWSAFGMVVYWISRLFFLFIVMDWYVQFYQTIFFFFGFFYCFGCDFAQNLHFITHTYRMRKHTKQK